MSTYEPKQNTLCWHCQNSVPAKDPETGEYIRGCNWSLNKSPVEGWRATRNDLKLQNNRTLESYIVHECPMYLEDQPRKVKRYKIGR